MPEKQRKPLARRVAAMLITGFLAVIFLYIAVQIFVIFHHTYKTETAIAYTMYDSVELNGVAVFEAVDVPGSGILGYLVSDGERVTGGSVIAERYTSDDQSLLRERLERLERSISLLSKSQAAGTDLSIMTNQTRQALYNLLDQMDTAQYSGITAAEDDFLLAQNRLQISTGQVENFDAALAALQSEYDAIASQLGTLDTVTAETNGYFICAELAPDIEPDEQALIDADPAGLQALLEAGFAAADSSRAGRIVTGFSWRFYAVCPLETAQRFETLSSVQISVPGKANTPLGATVEEVVLDEENGLGKIVLECRTIDASVLRLGVENARIDLYTYEGIRIDRAALHIVDGERGVYVKYGNLQKFLRITTLYENENYILVPKDGALGTENEVRLYDEIIVEGTNLQDGKLL